MTSPKINVSDTEAYDLSDSVAEIKDRFRGKNWYECKDAASEHARREARDIVEIEDRLYAAAFEVVR